jgi:hypothetical protein
MIVWPSQFSKLGRASLEICVDSVVRCDVRKSVASYCTPICPINDHAPHLVSRTRGDREGLAGSFVHRQRARRRDAPVHIRCGRDGIDIEREGDANGVVRRDAVERVRGPGAH